LQPAQIIKHAKVVTIRTYAAHNGEAVL